MCYHALRERKILCLGEWKSFSRVLISSLKVLEFIYHTINWSGEKLLISFSRALVKLSEIYLYIYCFVGFSSTIFGYYTSNALLFLLEICFKKKPFLALKGLFPFRTRHLTPAQTLFEVFKSQGITVINISQHIYWLHIY